MEEKKTNILLIVFRVLFTLALCWCVFFIFSNSLENGELSSIRSRQAAQIINGILIKFKMAPLSEFVIRKLGHFAEFTLLGFLLMLCLRVYTSHFIRYISWPLLFGMSTAVADETLQYYIPGRSSQVRDVWIDMSGVVIGIVAALIILLVIQLVISVHSAKKENKRLKAENANYRQQTENNF